MRSDAKKRGLRLQVGSMTHPPTNNATTTPTRLSFALIFLSSSVTALLACVCFYLYVNWRFDQLPLPISNCLDIAETKICFFNGNYDSDGMISVLSNFYTNLIVILIAILTIVVALATLSIRYSAKQHVEADLPTLTQSFFVDGRGTQIIDKTIEKRNEDIRTILGQIQAKQEEHSEFIDGFSGRLERLEYHLENIDTGEEVTSPDDEDEQ
jgi:hypothetical protein